MTKHPAPFSAEILGILHQLILQERVKRVLDPFAGIGMLASGWAHPMPLIALNELEPEWAQAAKRTEGHPVVGNTLYLPFLDEAFDCICTSPTYGNRMADHHEAKDGSHRVSYRHTLGRKLHVSNSGQMHWGPQYRKFHEAAWEECLRVLRPGGLFLLNVSNHIRGGELMQVSAWHVRTLKRLGRMKRDRVLRVRTPRMRFGANSELRTTHEFIHLFRKPS